MIFQGLEKYQQGHFFFEKGQSLKEQSKNVPSLPGVYYFLRISRGKEEIVYIGKSGTILTDGSFKKQTLNKRINNKQENIKRQQYLEQKIEVENIDALDVHWFVTFDDDHQDLPAFVEGHLMQQYFDTFGTLPPWNKDF